MTYVQNIHDKSQFWSQKKKHERNLGILMGYMC